MQALDEKTGDTRADEDQFLTFLLGGEEYGIEILDVQEIKNWGPYTPLPRAPSFVLGVINLRGAIVPVIDLRLRFGLEPVGYDSMTAVIIVRAASDSGARVVGLVVDRVSEVYRLEPSAIQESAEIVSGVRSSFIRGFGQIDDKMVILLNLVPVIESSLELADATG